MAKLLSVALMAVALVVVGCGGNADEAVALVNDEEIPRSEFQARVDQMASLYEMQGMPVDEQMTAQIERDVLDELINETLLVQQAEREGHAPSDAEVDQEYQEITAQFEDDAELDEALTGAGLTRDSLRRLIGEQIAIQSYLSAEMEAAGVQVTDEEVQDLYDSYSQQFGEMPPLEEIRPMLVEELERERQGRLVQGIIEDLRQASEITVLI